MSNEPAIVKCPICGKENEFFAQPTGPFCSSRCKLLDLGKWLDGDYKFSEPLRPDHFEDEELMGDDDPFSTPEEDRG